MSYGLYIHIPFCKHICAYCDFLKMVTLKEETMEKYINRLIDEFSQYEKYLGNIKTIYIGGGTPNVLPLGLLEKLLKKIDEYNKNVYEYTIEINPELLTLSQINLFKKYKINRVSMGCEAMDDDILKRLGRHHTTSDIINAYNMLKDNGIDNINLDFIYANPWDNEEIVNDMIDKILELNPNHLSLYTLILEDKTIFKYNNVEMLDEDKVSDLMDLVNKRLKDAGYNHYEISNYAKEGFEAIHNSLYWESMEYIGLGMGASGYLDSIRYDNEKSLNAYFRRFKKEEEYLSALDKKSEFMMLGLRMKKGISINKYQELFKSSPLDDFDMKDLLKYDLIKIDGDKIYMTYKGYKLGNVVFEKFI